MAARFYGEIGYTDAVEVRPGVYQDVITEFNYYGDVLKNSRRLENGDKVNNDITVNNSISIVADAYAIKHFYAIRYIKWAGTLWTVSEVTVESPRLILRLGGVYNGPTASPAGTP